MHEAIGLRRVDRARGVRRCVGGTTANRFGRSSCAGRSSARDPDPDGPIAFRVGRASASARSEHWSVSSPDAVLVRFDATTAQLRTEWEEWLAAGAFMSRSGYAGLPPVSIVESTLNGKANGGMRLSQSHSTRIHHATLAAVGRLRRRLVRVIRRSGGHIEHLRIIRPYGLGYALVVRTGRPAYYLKYRTRKLLRTLDDRWTRYEGAYIEVVDSRGKRVWVTAGSSRLQTGGGWIRPDLEGCSPVDVSWPTSHKVPRCPV